MTAADDAPTLDPLDADEVYARYLETCALLNVKPVSRDRARGPFAWWSAFISGEPPTEH